MSAKYITALFVFLMLTATCSTASAWLSYNHRMAITVENLEASILTDYQFNFTNDTNILVAAGKMQADGSDCRITDSSDNLIPFWNETAFNATNTTIWANATLEVGSNMFYMYYGNAAASSVANITITMEFGDDFNYEDYLDAAWTRLADMPDLRSQHGFEELNDILYAIGGAGGIGVHDTNTVYAYDPTTDIWTTKANVNSSVQSAILRAVNGKLYYIGGSGGSIINKNYEYDPVADTWTEKADMPTAREDMGSAVVDGKIYVFGGLSSSMTPLTKVEMYDPVANNWTTKADMPIARWSGDFACAYNGKIYLVSSSDTFAGYPAFHPISTVYEYDPVANNYTQKANISIGRGYKEVEELGGKLYVIGGVIEGWTGSFTNKNSVYDIANNTWSEKVETRYAVTEAGLTSYGGNIYISGGQGSDLSTRYTKHLYRLEQPDKAPLVPTGWNITNSTGGYFSFNNSIITLIGHSSGAGYSLTTENGFSPNIALRTKAKLGSATSIDDHSMGIGWCSDDGNDVPPNVNTVDYTNEVGRAVCGNGTNESIIDIGHSHFGEWYTYDIIRLGASTKFYKDGNLINDGIYDLNSDRYPHIEVKGCPIANVPGTSNYTHCDWIFVRKYTATEPTATLGAEEHAITAAANQYTQFNDWETAHTFSQIAALNPNDVCYSWYNHTSGLHEAYYVGRTYNAAKIIPMNCSAFGFFDTETIIEIATRTSITIPNAAWFYGFLPGTSSMTVTDLNASMNTDGLACQAVYRWDGATWNATGIVQPKEGIITYNTNAGEWTP